MQWWWLAGPLCFQWILPKMTTSIWTKKNGTFQRIADLFDFPNTSRIRHGERPWGFDGDGLPEIFTYGHAAGRSWASGLKSVGEGNKDLSVSNQEANLATTIIRSVITLQLNREFEKGFSEIALYAEFLAFRLELLRLWFLIWDNDGPEKDIHVTNGIVKRPEWLGFIQYSREVDPNTKNGWFYAKIQDWFTSRQLKLDQSCFRQGLLDRFKFSNWKQHLGIDQPRLFQRIGLCRSGQRCEDLDLVIKI